MDMATAIQYLSEPDNELKVMGAAYIQHVCYNNKEAKDQVAQTE